MFGKILNKTKESINNAKEISSTAIDSGLDTVKTKKDATLSIVSNQVDSVKVTAGDTLDKSIEKASEIKTSATESIENTKKEMSETYEEKIKVFLDENTQMVKEEAMKNELFARLVVEGLTVAVAIPIVATIIYNVLPGPIQFVVEEDTFVSFVDENINLFIDILDLAIEVDI